MAVSFAGIGAEGQLVRVPSVPEHDRLAGDEGKPVRVRRASFARSLRAALRLMNMQFGRAAFIFFCAVFLLHAAPYIAAGGVSCGAGAFMLAADRSLDAIARRSGVFAGIRILTAAGSRAIQSFAFAAPGAGFVCAAGFAAAPAVV